jgi:mannose-6-phosphate isomerase-like protein (cupin superfamily)
VGLAIAKQTNPPLSFPIFINYFNFLKELPTQVDIEEVKNPRETIWELFCRAHELGWGIAIADIDQSTAHYHKESIEVYVVVEGKLAVIIDGRNQYLNPGETVTICPGSVHQANSMTESPCRLVTISIPAWQAEDHYLANQDTGLMSSPD